MDSTTKEPYNNALILLNALIDKPANFSLNEKAKKLIIKQIYAIFSMRKMINKTIMKYELVYG
jgi:hypothetical protein